VETTTFTKNLLSGMGEDYEALPDCYPLGIHMVAGSFAGVVEHSAMYPIDSVKTQMQSLKNVPYRGLGNAIDTMVRANGVRSMFRGMGAMLSGAGPAHALYFGSYETIKKKLPEKIFENQNMQSCYYVYGIAGLTASFFHDIVMTPAEVIKQRMQMYNSSYKNCTSCMMDIYRREGPSAFYRSFWTSYSMNAPFQVIHFVVYEKCQKILNPECLYDPKSHMISGATAGGFAAFATNPLDVCKTLLNTQQHQNSSTIYGLRSALRTVFATNGFRTFFRGSGARVLYQAPSTALSWSVYEFFKRNILDGSTLHKSDCSDIYSDANFSCHTMKLKDK